MKSAPPHPRRLWVATGATCSPRTQVCILVASSCRCRCRGLLACPANGGMSHLNSQCAERQVLTNYKSPSQFTLTCTYLEVGMIKSFRIYQIYEIFFPDHICPQYCNLSTASTKLLNSWAKLPCSNMGALQLLQGSESESPSVLRMKMPTSGWKLPRSKPPQGGNIRKSLDKI